MLNGPVHQGTNMDAQDSAEIDRLLTEAGKHPAQCVCRVCVKCAFDPDYMNAGDDIGIEVSEDEIAARCAVAGLLAICALVSICMGVAAYNGWL